MKRFSTALSLLLFVTWSAPVVEAASREALWKEVEAAVAKGLPKTAIEKLEPIIQGALRDKAWGEATKAIARRVVLEGNIQGNKPEEKITRMEAELARAPKEIQPLLDTILANWYWHYYLNNRWRFMRRTQTAQAPGKDFTTWDLPRLFAEIDKQFQKALANAAALKKTPVSAFDDLLAKGALPDIYRPTLYDFIAHEALKFYTSGEQAAAKPEDAFELSADSPIFDNAARFMAWDWQRAAATLREAESNPTAGRRPNSEAESPVLKALRFYQDLLQFHQNDTNPDAFVDADIARLAYGYNAAFGEEKNTRYKSALKVLVEQWADHELSALALHNWARVLRDEGDLVEARNLALRGANAFPASAGGKLCRNLVSEIEAKSVALTTERVWNCQKDTVVPPVAGQIPRDTCPTIEIRYRNLTNVHFRAVAYDWNLFLQKNHTRPEYLNDAERQELIAKAPAFEWSAELPPTSDFKERIEKLPAPDQLKAGFYFLIASHKPDFSETNNQVSFTDFWVSSLALVVRPRGGEIEGFVLEANSGEPVTGAEVMSWHLDNQGNRIPRSPLPTDLNGFFSFKSEPNRTYLLRVRHEGRELGSQQEYNSYRYEPTLERGQTVFFMDRAIYRPGQTIQYKGICLRADTEKDDYQVLPGQEVTVIFADPNNKEISRQKHRCNDYGSFSGSVTAPRDRLMGRMQIYVTVGPNGQVNFNVEEYKRPKFQVTLDAPKTAVKLKDKVPLAGHATSYTGAAVDGAQVKYRVAREVRYPYWWGWYSWRRQQPQGSQEIAHGTTRTEPDGSFKIEFVAKPDLSVSENDEPTFVYSIYTDVTDSSGETRSAQRSINVGYTALQATVGAAAWQIGSEPVELTISTTTLDGEPQVAEGSLKIHRLEAPAQVQRANLGGIYYGSVSFGAEKPDLSNPNNWPLGEVLAEHGFTTDAEGHAKWQVNLGPGVYRATLETQDRFGKKVTARWPIQVLNPGDTRLTIKIPHLLDSPSWSLEPGGEFMALWGTGYDLGRAFIEIEHRNKMIQRYWTRAGQTQEQIKQAVTEAMRGGFTLHVTQVHDNRAYLDSRHVDVPWSNKDLDIKWEHFTSKLEPNQTETWTAVVQIGKPKTEGQNAERAVAEMVATLYDSSLDQFTPFYWQQRFGFFRQDYSAASAVFENSPKQFQWLRGPRGSGGSWGSSYESVSLSYREFPADLVANHWGYAAVESKAGGILQDGRHRMQRYALAETMAPAMEVNSPAEAGAKLKREEEFFAADSRGIAGDVIPSSAPSKGLDLSQVTARKNMNETAFFFPQLVSDSNGVVRMTFAMPEALTEWKFMGFAHDRNVRSGYLEGKAVSSKDLMVQPNPPRFVREGDLIEFTVKVSNQSTNRQVGKVRLTFDDLRQSSAGVSTQNQAKGQAGRRPNPDGTTTDKVLGNHSPELACDIPAKESRSFSWRIRVPDGLGFLTYKAVGSTGKVSDGEEGFLPVLSRRVLVTESLPLAIRGPGTKKFEFGKLLKSGKSGTLQNQSLTVQMVSNPAWYAVMALPYLMEFPHECTEQTFNRHYANALARFIARSDPKVHGVFEQWRNTPALDSPLEKNQDLKSLMLEETPWLQQAQSESQARRNVGILFDDNRLDYETENTLRKLSELQLPDGSWPWFPGGRGNDYITLYITIGFGRLRHLGVDVKVEPAIRALNRLDDWLDETYREILAHGQKEDNHLTPTVALYLYGRSFYLKDKGIDPKHNDAVDYFLGQARKFWLGLANRQSQGHLAIGLKRFDAFKGAQDGTPSDIMKSIKERSVTNEELGMFWRETELSWWWYRAPIETQALMIEAFDEVMSDRQAVEDAKVWLLKQKQTQDWKTTKATADAVYALLLRGRELLSSDKLVEVTVGGVALSPSPSPQPSPSGRGSSAAPLPARPDALSATAAGNVSPSPRGVGQGEGNPRDDKAGRVEPGTGFYERRFAGSEIKPKLGEITVRKIDEGVAWGSVHWQYLEDISKVTSYAGTPLKLKKTLFTKVNTKKGPVLEAVKGALGVGDELVVRVELRVDRDMEYIHLKDQRGSGTEPVNVISGYKYQDGLAYYESTRDTASHFFIDYLPKGTYVFEYSTRVQLRGEYQTGIAEIQCMYAPEFNSHSESIALTVK